MWYRRFSSVGPDRDGIPLRGLKGGIGRLPKELIGGITGFLLTSRRDLHIVARAGRAVLRCCDDGGEIPPMMHAPSTSKHSTSLPTLSYFLTRPQLLAR